MSTKFKYDFEPWVRQVFGTLEGEKDGKPFFAVLYKDGHWDCDHLEICTWLNDVASVVSRGNPYEGGRMAMFAARRKLGGKLTIITEEEFSESAVRKS